MSVALVQLFNAGLNFGWIVDPRFLRGNIPQISYGFTHTAAQCHVVGLTVNTIEQRNVHVSTMQDKLTKHLSVLYIIEKTTIESCRFSALLCSTLCLKKTS